MSRTEPSRGGARAPPPAPPAAALTGPPGRPAGPRHDPAGRTGHSGDHGGVGADTSTEPRSAPEGARTPEDLDHNAEELRALRHDGVSAA
ncbi:hypothetical protein ACFW9X_33125, partial [Streptomyces sp. NPDC059466]